MIEKKKLSDFKGGWFVGNFDPAIIKTEEFEVSVKEHVAGEKTEKHYHKVALEVNCVVSGEVLINGENFCAGDVFVVHPGEVVDPIFQKDCTIVCVKSPSDVNDKFVVER